jgi:DNA-binding MurR/RpiR family transcriptional regulator
MTMSNVLEDRIKRNYRDLTRSQKRIAEYILGNPEDVVFLSSRSLGQKVGVSDATVVRFSNALGISGYPELQRILQSWLKVKFTPSEKLKSTSTGRQNRIYAEIFKTNLENLMKTQQEIEDSKIDDAIEALNGAKRVFVLGLRRSHSIAFHLYYNLSHILDNVVLISTSYGLPYDQIVEIGKQDVLVSVSFPRYAKGTAEITRAAKQRGASIIAITDHPLSPIGRIADVSLQVSLESPFFFGSPVSAIVVADCIVGGLSLKHKTRNVARLKRFENTLKRFGVWLS